MNMNIEDKLKGENNALPKNDIYMKLNRIF